MEALGQLALKIYTDFGLVATCMIILLFVGLYHLTLCGTRALASWLKIKFSIGVKHVNLEKHVVFSKLDTLINYRIANMHMQCPLRTKIFADLLTFRMTALRDILKDFVKTDVDSLSAADFRQAMADRLQAMEFTWTAKALHEGMPAIALDKFKEYNDRWGGPVTNIILDQCLITTAYQTNTERLDSILDMIGSFEIHCFSDVEKAVASINGELSGVSYKGMVCQDCSDDCTLKAHKTKETQNEKAV